MLNFFIKRNLHWSHDILSGLTTAILMIPQGIIISYMSGVNPGTGIGACIIGSMIHFLFNSRPGMISATSFASTFILVEISSEYGYSAVAFSVVGVGILHLVFGYLKLGKFSRMIPNSVLRGFINGSVIIVFISQINNISVVNELINYQSNYFLEFLALAATIGIVYFWPKISSFVPGTLMAAIIGVSIIKIFDIPVIMMSDLIESAFNIESFDIVQLDNWKEFDWRNIPYLLPSIFILFVIGVTESLLTMSFIDDITNTRGNGNRLPIALGVANIISGIFGFTTVSASVEASILNIRSGGNGRYSALYCALFLIVFAFIGIELLNFIPLFLFAGIFFLITAGVFDWAGLKIIHKVPSLEAFTIIIVTVMTALLDNPALAVILGVVLATLIFAWENARRIRARKKTLEDGTKVYQIYGPLFFGATDTFMTKFNAELDPSSIIIDFQESRIMDHSAVEAIIRLVSLYESYEKKVTILNVSSDTQSLIEDLNKSKNLSFQASSDIIPNYKVATDLIKKNALSSN